MAGAAGRGHLLVTLPSSSMPSAQTSGGMAAVLEQNIGKMAELRRVAEARRDRKTRIADAITRFAGSMTSVSVHAALFGGWILLNSGLVPGVRPFDPFPFVMLAMFASVEAIFLSTFVLISQNRMTALANRRDELDVQISLLSEHEITRIIEMLDALLKHHGIAAARPDEIEVLKQDVAPDEVVSEIEKVERGTKSEPRG
jgi:uncharacterized membrane protein